MKLVLASKNTHKLEELRAILSRQGVEVVLEGEEGLRIRADPVHLGHRPACRCGRLRPVRRRAQRRAGGLLSPVRRTGFGRRRPLQAPAGEYAGHGGQTVQIRLLYLRLLPRRCNGHCPWGVPRHPGLCPQGGGRLWVRPHLLRTRTQEDLRPTHRRGEERHLPPGGRPQGI